MGMCLTPLFFTLRGPCPREEGQGVSHAAIPAPSHPTSIIYQRIRGSTRMRYTNLLLLTYLHILVLPALTFHWISIYAHTVWATKFGAVTHLWKRHVLGSNTPRDWRGHAAIRALKFLESITYADFVWKCNQIMKVTTLARPNFLQVPSRPDPIGRGFVGQIFVPPLHIFIPFGLDECCSWHAICLW